MPVRDRLVCLNRQQVTFSSPGILLLLRSGAPPGQIPVPQLPPGPAGLPPLPRFVPGPAPVTQAEASPPGRPAGLLRVSGLKFVDDRCNEWLPAGWNSCAPYQLSFDPPPSFAMCIHRDALPLQPC